MSEQRISIMDAECVYTDAHYTVTRGIVGAQHWTEKARGTFATGWVVENTKTGRQRVFATRKAAILHIDQALGKGA
jgi:hypothetical protein